MTITKLNPTIEAIWGSERRRKADGAERVRDLGPPWRDLIRKYLYWGDVSVNGSNLRLTHVLFFLVNTTCH